jgi:hypothetical protein
MIAELATIARPQAVQIDFDAPSSAWPFYRELLSEVRGRLGPNIFLSVTALVSWCDAKNWLGGLPVDEVVPMAFYMGSATPAIVTMLQRGGQFSAPGCRASIGVELPLGNIVPLGPSVDQSVRPRKDQRAYFFLGSRQWTPEFVSKAARTFQQ